jgi:hypothetical protein
MSFAAHITPTADFQSASTFYTGTLITFTANFQSAGASAPCAGTLAAIGGGAAISLLRAAIHLDGTTKDSPHIS